ncbi:hypothetical protein PHMEG_00029985 [Phytophthora megakarya]|uniref:Uncharacterized protein n=1 Tax=Phytophthora megakarya TaxID=4795 RepID=A0A225V1D2_9STRA|nr:hypothetical protein PHMEG_00029985 [Phytophthora megakarya]
MVNPTTPFPTGCFVWLTWRRVWYLARVEEVDDTKEEVVKVLVHVHGESFMKDKWWSVYRDGTSVVDFPPLRLLRVLSSALTGIGALPAVGNHVQLLVMDQTVLEIITSRRTDDDPNREIPTLVGIVVKILPARDASLVDVAYPTELVSTNPDKVQWQRVQIGNGYVSCFSLQHNLFTESRIFSYL